MSIKSQRISAIIGMWFWQVQCVAAQPAVITSGLGSACNFRTGMLSPACIPLFIGHLIQLLFSLIGTFFLFNVMYAGYLLAVSGWSGDKPKGKDRLTWSIIGIIVCASAYLILDVVLTIIVGA
jgi:hypothetical protein